MNPDLTLRSEIRAWLHGVNGGNWNVGDLNWRTHSITAVAADPDFSDRKLFIKLPRPDDKNSQSIANQFEAEFSALSMATEVFGPVSSEFSVPRPICKSDRGWFAMEFLEGKRVDHLLASGISPSRKNEVLSRMGRWISHLHNGFATESRTYDFESYRGRILTWPLSRYPRFIKSAMRTLDSLLSQLNGVRLPCSRIHGDLKIDNFLICNDQQLIGFDLNLAHINPVVFDLASFLNRLDAWVLSPGGLLSLLSGRKNLERSFLSGYGWTDQSRENSVSLIWMRLALACATYDDLLTNSQRTRGPLRRWTLALRYEITIKALTRRLAASADNRQHD
jgi:aminoglycoside phosphotransferase (APT) family kinase protein